MLLGHIISSFYYLLLYMFLKMNYCHPSSYLQRQNIMNYAYIQTPKRIFVYFSLQDFFTTSAVSTSELIHYFEY